MTAAAKYQRAYRERKARASEMAERGLAEITIAVPVEMLAECGVIEGVMRPENAADPKAQARAAEHILTHAMRGIIRKEAERRVRVNGDRW